MNIFPLLIIFSIVFFPGWWFHLHNPKVQCRLVLYKNLANTKNKTIYITTTKNETNSIMRKNKPSATNHANAISVIACEGGPLVNIIGRIMRSAFGITSRYMIFSFSPFNAHEWRFGTIWVSIHSMDCVVIFEF